MRDQLAAIYLDYINNYLTVATFAEHNGLTVDDANLLLTLARNCHEQPHPEA